MDTSKIIKGVVSNGRYTVTAPIVKENYGIVLKIEGAELPEVYQIDFCNTGDTRTITMVGNADGVLIPRQFIDTGKDIDAYLYYVGDGFGKTVYQFHIPNKYRPDRTNEQPTPEEQSVIDQTIAALNEAAETAQENAGKAETAVEHYPQIVDGTWRVWDVENGQWLDTGIDAEAVDGVSPEVYISNTNGIHTVTIIDANGRKTATIYDGLSIIMLISSFVIPTDENGVLTQDVKLVAKFRIMRGNTIIDGRVMPNSSVTLVNPNAPQLKVVYWQEGVSVTDPQTEVTLSSGYKLLGNDSGMFSIKLRVGNTDYVVNPTWSLAKRGEKGEKGEKGDSPAITASKTGKTTSIYVDDSEVAQIEDGTDGTDGVSPRVSFVPIAGGIRLTITDKDGDHSADIMNGTGSVDDVQIDGTSIVSDGVANVPYASSNVPGVVKILNDRGISLLYGTTLQLVTASVSHIKGGTAGFFPICPSTSYAAAFYGLAKVAGHDERYSTLPVGQYTDDAKSAISEMLGGSVAVTGTTPTIVAKSGIRYVCGEVATLDFTPSQTGICDVVFTSGATATVLTVPNTIKWANGFDPAALDANTTYEINIMDGLGVACAWA